MRIFKILLLSTALAAFGAATAIAQPVQYAAKTDDGTTTTKPKKAKKIVAKKHVKKVVKAKKPRKKLEVAKVKRKSPPSTDTETAPGNPPPGSSTN